MGDPHKQRVKSLHGMGIAGGMGLAHDPSAPVGMVSLGLSQQGPPAGVGVAGEVTLLTAPLC